MKESKMNLYNITSWLKSLSSGAPRTQQLRITPSRRAGFLQRLRMARLPRSGSGCFGVTNLD